MNLDSSFANYFTDKNDKIPKLISLMVTIAPKNTTRLSVLVNEFNYVENKREQYIFVWNKNRGRNCFKRIKFTKLTKLNNFSIPKIRYAQRCSRNFECYLYDFIWLISFDFLSGSWYYYMEVNIPEIFRVPKIIIDITMLFWYTKIIFPMLLPIIKNIR